MDPIIGTTTTYHGTEHRYLAGHKLRIVSVMRGGAAPVWDPEADFAWLSTDAELARAGGVSADDRVEVQPWLETERRYSFVTSNPRAVDLAAFAHLAR